MNEIAKHIQSISAYLLLAIMLAGVNLVSQDALSQGDFADLYIVGTVADYDTRLKLEKCTVNVYVNEKIRERYITGAKGNFEFFLALDETYKFEVECPSYLNKLFIVNTENIPMEDRRGGFAMKNMAISLFKPIEGVDYSILEQPIGKASYNEAVGSIEWNKAYTESIAVNIKEMVDDHESNVK